MKKITSTLLMLLAIVIMTACGAAAPTAEVPVPEPQESPAPRPEPVKDEPLAPPEEPEVPEVKSEIIEISARRMTGTETRYENGTSDYEVTKGALHISAKGIISGFKGSNSNDDYIYLDYTPDISDVSERARLVIYLPFGYSEPLLKDFDDEWFLEYFPNETIDLSAFSRTETEDAYQAYLAWSFDDTGFPNGKRGILWREDKKTHALYQIMALASGSLADAKKLYEIADRIEVSTIAVEDCDLEAKDVVVTKVAKGGQENNKITEWGLSNYKVSYIDPATGRLLQINANGFGSGIIPADNEGSCEFLYTFDGRNVYGLYVTMFAEKTLYSLQDASDEEIINGCGVNGTPDMTTFERVETASDYRVYVASDWEGAWDVTGERQYILLFHDKKSGALFRIMIVGGGLYADDARLRGMIDRIEVSLAAKTGEAKAEAKDVVITEVSKESHTEPVTEKGLSNYNVSYTDPATGRLLQIHAAGLESGIIPSNNEGSCEFFYTSDKMNIYSLSVKMLAEKNGYQFQTAGDQEIIDGWGVDGTPDIATFKRVETKDAYRVYIASDIGRAFGDGDVREYIMLLHDKKSGALFRIGVRGAGIYADDARLRGILYSVGVSLAE